MTHAWIGELDIVMAAELADRNFPPVFYVVDGYIAEGLTILAGKAKSGRSLNFAVAVAAAVRRSARSRSRPVTFCIWRSRIIGDD